ncbi:hypothetical protein [Trinickia dinghuensis]|nr:hypothetical protein [Trinickia dinghuensis]
MILLTADCVTNSIFAASVMLFPSITARKASICFNVIIMRFPTL